MPKIDTTEPMLLLTIDATAVDVQWENNAAVTELYALAQNAITVNTSAYGGFEQVGSLPQSFSRNDVQTTPQPRDIVLYSGNQLVIFFGSNSWSYTKLGHIEGLSTDELTPFTTTARGTTASAAPPSATTSTAAVRGRASASR